MVENKVYSLKNSELSVDIRPAEGGRISSLKSRKSGLEFLTQSQRSGPYSAPGMNVRYQDGFCAGIEECLPTVGLCGPGTDGGAAPDHGDFWQLPWQLLEVSRAEVSLSAMGFSRPLKFSKRAALESATLRVLYNVENQGATPQSFLYACHPLFSVSSGDRIFLPDEVQELTLDYTNGNRLSAEESTVTWPVTRSGHRLDIALGPDSGTAEMFYTSCLKDTTCGIYRKTSGQVLEVSFDSQRLPYLGLWLCYGGWPSDALGPLQYAVALEPTTAPCNTLTRARQAKAAVILKPGESYHWEISFSIRQSGS